MSDVVWLRFRPFPSRRNSMNMFRLIFAAMVLFAHSWYTAGLGTGPSFNNENLGGWAVAGFFVLSGFLITGSRMSHTAGEYLVHRVARIFPAFLVCLAVTAFVFGPIALYAQHHTLAGYFSTGPTPLNYIWSNVGLHINDYGIGHSLDTVPYKDVWDGSLWTLYYEFLCYLIIWIIGGLLVVRRSVIPVAILWALSVANYANLGFATRLGLDQDFMLLSRLLPFFLGGSIVFYIVRRWGVSPVIGIASVVIAACCICFVPNFGGQASAPFLAYGLIWLSTVIPQPAFIARNDISYGFYIYAWPMQQLVTVFAGDRHGMWLYWLITAVLTTGLALGSWYLVERPVLRLVKRGRVEIPIGEGSPEHPVRTRPNGAVVPPTAVDQPATIAGATDTGNSAL
ncbi:acyltransferase [Humibacter antri]